MQPEIVLVVQDDLTEGHRYTWDEVVIVAIIAAAIVEVEVETGMGVVIEAETGTEVVIVSTLTTRSLPILIRI